MKRIDNLPLPSLFFRVVLFVLCSLIVTTGVDANEKPSLLLAKKYQQNIDLDKYWVSEKYDGYRAYWNGQYLISRQGHRFAAPSWFTKSFPSQPLDGELWIDRQSFEQLASVVRREKPHLGWQKVKYMVFDSPSSQLTFTQRLDELKVTISKSKSPYLKLITQFKITTHDSLMSELTLRVDAGAEGLMLHRGDSYYHSGRTGDLLKLKPLQDAEARVLQHLEGKGKYESMLGALLVELPSGITFRLGTGFTDALRADPPAIGSVVTFQYTGLTQRGIPRFARFLRIRSDVRWQDMKNFSESL